MSGTISVNPYATTSPYPNFQLATQGGVQGLPFDDTVARLWLKEGLLASTETLPMWGGVPVNIGINNSGAGPAGTGAPVARATSAATTNGWSTFYQMAHMVIVPGNSVPLIGVNASVGYFLNGTNIQLWVQVDPDLVAAAAGASITGLTLYWNTTDFWVTTSSSGGFALPTSYKLDMTNTNSKVVSWSSPNATWTSGDAALLII